jgi:hypothetical protein
LLLPLLLLGVAGPPASLASVPYSAGTHRPSSVGQKEYIDIRSMWLSGKAGGAGAASDATGGAGRAREENDPAAQTPLRPAAAASKSGRVADAHTPARASSHVPMGGGVAKTSTRKAPFRTGQPSAAASRPAARPAFGVGKSSADGQVRECTVTLAFVSKYRFAATSSFPPKEVSAAYKMNMGRYEPDSKRWTFAFEHYHKLVAHLQHLCRTPISGFKLSLKSIPDPIISIVREGLGGGACGASTSVARANASAVNSSSSNNNNNNNNNASAAQAAPARSSGTSTSTPPVPAPL